MKNNDKLIKKMIADAWLAGDKDRAFYLYDQWMYELTPQLEADLRPFFGESYEEIMAEGVGTVQ